MMYFQGNSFYPFALDWQEQSNGRQVIPGLGIYFLHPDEGKWTRDEIDRQINFIRNHKMAGEGHYRVKYLMENTQGIYDELLRIPGFTATDALVGQCSAHSSVRTESKDYRQWIYGIEMAGRYRQ